MVFEPILVDTVPRNFYRPPPTITVATLTNSSNWGSTAYTQTIYVEPIVRVFSFENECCRYGASAVPPQPPPIALDLCTKEPFPEVVVRAGHRFVWFPDRQSRSRERSSRRRKLRTWER